MQVIRTIVWVFLVIALLLFSFNNWQPVDVKIWEGLVLETKLPALVLVSFLLGLVPMWLLSKAGKWRLNRKINALEKTVQATVAPSHPPIATSSQLDAQAQGPSSESARI